MTDYYEILGVPRDASADEIKGMYKRRAMRFHPDKGGGVEEFAQLSEAYKVLSDPELRAKYDRGEDTSKPVPTVEAMAMERLAMMFTEHIQKCRPDQDMIAIMRENIQQGRSNLVENRSKMDKSLDDIEKLRKRVTHKGDKPDILANVLDNAVQSINKGLEQNEREREIQDLVLGMLEDYAMNIEPAPSVSATQFLSGTSYFQL